MEVSAIVQCPATVDAMTATAAAAGGPCGGPVPRSLGKLHADAHRLAARKATPPCAARGIRPRSSSSIGPAITGRVYTETLPGVAGQPARKSLVRRERLHGRALSRAPARLGGVSARRPRACPIPLPRAGILELLAITKDTELEVVTDGERIIIEPVRSKAAREEHQRRVATSTKKVLTRHRELFAKLAK
jgi:hypothetical protein